MNSIKKIHLALRFVYKTSVKSYLSLDKYFSIERKESFWGEIHSSVILVKFNFNWNTIARKIWAESKMFAWVWWHLSKHRLSYISPYQKKNLRTEYAFCRIPKIDDLSFDFNRSASLTVSSCSSNIWKVEYFDTNNEKDKLSSFSWGHSPQT